MATCDKCNRNPIVMIRYSGAHLCGKHFSDFVEKRVKHELRRQLDPRGAKKIAVAVSGGKDSSVALHLVNSILGKRKGLEICAITVDEGIAGYRESSIALVEAECRSLNLQHIVVSFKDLFGTAMDEIASKDRPLSTCSYCGVLRRVAMNRAAREWGATHLATGLNLDDTAQSILMNLARGDVRRLARLGPHKQIQPELVPRVQPLRTIPESETMLYALVNKLKFHDLECPYAPEALRNEYRAVVTQLESKYPGTRHALLRSYDEMLPALENSFPAATLARCSCGEPTVGTICKACELLQSLKERAT